MVKYNYSCWKVVLYVLQGKLQLRSSLETVQKVCLKDDSAKNENETGRESLSRQTPLVNKSTSEHQADDVRSKFRTKTTEPYMILSID